jgi:hypothetical protein
MSLITITKEMKMPEHKSVLIGSDAKNALPLRTVEGPWTDIAGLSWIFVGDDF